MQFVCDNIVPLDPARAEVVCRGARFFKFIGGKLLLKGQKGELYVPPLRDRPLILSEASQVTSHTSGERLY